MNPRTLNALEFDRIAEVVRSFSLTPLGAARVAALRPHTDPRRVSQALAATSEATRLLENIRGLPLQAAQDIEATLGLLGIEGRPLEPLRLRALADFLDSVEATATAIRSAPGRFPILRAIADISSSFSVQVSEVRASIDPSGEVLDEASPELRNIRDRLRRLRNRLRGTLESFIRGRETSRYLQDQIVTDRNGRYVLLVRAEHRAAIPGIIHGSSTSGATLYLEPLSTVEVNNEIVALEEQESEEVRRILLALSDGFRRRAAALYHTVEAAAELDAIQARAGFSELVGGVEPTLSSDGAMELLGARHPFLMPGIRARIAALSDTDSNEQAIEPVPVDIRLTAPSAALVVTGPNTGGKTVALKTAGLLALMAQAGLHVPALPGSRLPVFRTIFADIGDEQSIAANLSTFSWHITNIAGMDRSLAIPALVLLDEVGAGTDPVEGGALGVAIIEHFRRRGALVVATTHHDALKSYASGTPGVLCAAFGFNPETFAPTYKLVYGSPGRSLALEIAGRLGLNGAILTDARSRIGEREAQLAEHLARIESELQGLDHERRLAARERQTLSDLEQKMRTRERALEEAEERLRRRSEQKIDERGRQARLEIDRIVEELKRRGEQITADAARRLRERGTVLTTGEAGSIRAEARKEVDAVVERLSSGAEKELPITTEPERPPTVGDSVVFLPLGVVGVVDAVGQGDAEVSVNGKRFRARLTDLKLEGRAVPRQSRVQVNVQLQPRGDLPADLNVIGCTVDQALERAERFLDETLLSERRTVRVIHGYGTGQLRRALAEFFQSHPLVATFATAPPEQGGGGVTVVELKE
jgi:DNA mismatch repair protein MutS2